MSNIYDDKDEQLVLTEKATALMKFLNEEPRAKIIPYLSVDSSGIRPDAKLVLIETKPEHDNIDKDDTGDSGDSAEESTEAESSEPQSS